MAGRERILLDPQWRFFKGDFQPPRESGHWAKGANFDWGPIDPSFDDSRWRLLDLPHDFVVEGDFDRRDPQNKHPIEKELDQHFVIFSHMMHGFKNGGVAWYRKTFHIPKEDLGRRLALVFDGVFRDSKVWLNRNFVGQQPSGYMGFRYDISELLNYGDWNTLVVRVDASEYEGWFYEGGGIYRHVWLEKTDPLHVAPHGVFVQCEVELTGAQPRAQAKIETVIGNEQAESCQAKLSSVIQDAAGNPVARIETDFELNGWAEQKIHQTIDIPQPKLWSPDAPTLYTLVSQVICAGQADDIVQTTFGIRKVHFDPDQGFFLNDQPLKIKGVCCHQDHAGVGSALPDGLQAYRIARLKEMGCNAYRSAHHPPTPELLDACDRLGMLFLDEHRILGTAPDIMNQLEALIRRDRNHPSIFLWSVGNEENAIQGTDMGARIVARMKVLINQLDPSRLMTLAMNGAWGQGASAVIDVQGCNYIFKGVMDKFHAEHPQKPVLFTEAASAVGTRGIYANDPARGYMSAYDVNAAVWGDTHEANWRYCAERPFVAGTFIWTGFDYRGEPTPYFAWPCINSHFGILDTCGFPKDVFHYYKAWWDNQPVLHLLPHWNWPGREGEIINVWAYANCDEVELFLNERSLGRQTMPLNGHLEWQVPYAPGVLSAIGLKNGHAISKARVETTGPAHALRLIPELANLQANGEDVAVIRVEVLDAQGRLVPDAGNRVEFALEGAGQIIGVGNGDPSCHDADKATSRTAFNGLAQIILQSTREPGSMRLTASSPGLLSATLDLAVSACEPRPWMPAGNAGGEMTYACSELLPMPQSIATVAYPPASRQFQALTSQDGGVFCDTREIHKLQNGLLYIRAMVEIPAGGLGYLLYGADGAVKVWVNEQEVGYQPTASNPAKPEEYRARVTWQPGNNIIMFALNTNHGRAWGVSARATLGI